jgi:hypothetical protein
MKDELGTKLLSLIERIDSRLSKLEGAERPKDWYSPDEVATLLRRKPYTVREWARKGRIVSQKDEYSGKRMIPANEVERLRSGGHLLPA